MEESRWAFRRMSSQPRLPFPGHKAFRRSEGVTRSAPELLTKYKFASTTILTPQDFTKRVSNFVLQNPAEWDDYILQNTRLETLNKWITKKKSLLQNQKQQNLAKNDADVTSEAKQLGEQVEAGDYLPLLYKLSAQLNDFTLSSGFSFYASNGSGDSLHLYNPDLQHWKNKTFAKTRVSSSIPRYPIGLKSTVASHVAFTSEPLIVDDVTMDDRFPKGIAKSDSAAVSVMCLPMKLPTGDLLGVIELHRNWEGAAYTADILMQAQNLVDWVMLAVSKTEVNRGLKRQTEMSKFLLEVSRTYLDDITNIDNIVRHIMRFAKNLVSAERCSLFLYEKETGELYSNTFDAGEEDEGETVFLKQAEIRFPISKGIAGFAATTREVINVADAYTNEKFNREVDKITGYTTKSILCIPIMGDDEVYGVVEMINKKGGGSFTNADQDHFQTFTVFCALALRYAKVHSRLLLDQCRYEIVREQYLYHSRVSEADLNYVMVNLQQRSFADRIPPDLDRLFTKLQEKERENLKNHQLLSESVFILCIAPSSLSRDRKIKMEQAATTTTLQPTLKSFKFHFSIFSYQNELLLFFVKMVNDVAAGEISVPDEIISNFVLTVRNNYRDLPYHNWYHAMIVCHSMYCILIRNFDIFDAVERFSLIIACLCHDIDHRSMSNQFLSLADHPLTKLYPHSTMEHHHIQLTLDILGRDRHNLVAGCNEKDREKAIALIRNCILATDLASYFENQAYLDELLNKTSIDFDNPEQRTAVLNLMMSACDLSTTTKQWHDTKNNVQDLYTEFWLEGDRRKEFGFSFLPMMDRDMADDMAHGQVSFYSIVIVKCFETLSKILPTCKAMEIGAKLNLERWREEAAYVASAKDERERIILQQKQRERDLEEQGGALLVDSGGLWVIDDSTAEEKESRMLLQMY